LSLDREHHVMLPSTVMGVSVLFHNTLWPRPGVVNRNRDCLLRGYSP
jgi:hypothetical protein